ncbi:hypothetical protein Tsubulata_027913 [Turnera subulata]|uniref:Glycosyltransferase n=1 Tax=Turnera subulata TaxID=218843 RepID=A0A9Q0GKS2_9ROSI|nr:hypothetical protein Tsubulata_027913 [Turnera subulata]
MSMELYLAFGQNFVLPGMELCKLVASPNCNASLIISSAHSHLVPASFRQNTMTPVLEIPAQAAGTESVSVDVMKQSLECYLTIRRSNEPGAVGAIVDVSLLRSMRWLVDVFSHNHIPITGFFTSSAFSTAMEYDASTQDDKSVGLLGCLPGWGFAGVGPKVIGLSEPGDHPPWMGFTKKFMGAMINTVDDLERPYVEDLAKKLKLRVWPVGPLLPREYFSLVGTAVRSSNEGEASVIDWLDSRPRRSVLFVSSVGLTAEEYPRLVDALKASTHSFIWVVRPGGYYPEVDDSVMAKGLITSEMVPNCMVLNHPSTAGFLCNCSWEPLMEAIGLGVPILAWPKTSEQLYNAKLVVKRLKVGYYVCDKFSHMVNGLVTVKGIGKGIDMLMGDKHMEGRTADLGARFSWGFPQSSRDALVRFTDDLALL